MPLLMDHEAHLLSRANYYACRAFAAQLKHELYISCVFTVKPSQMF